MAPSKGVINCDTAAHLRSLLSDWLNDGAKLGSFGKDEVDDSENVIWKCNFAFLQPFLNYSKSLRLQSAFLTILKFNWNQRLRDKRTKLNICHHMLTMSTQL